MRLNLFILTILAISRAVSHGEDRARSGASAENRRDGASSVADRLNHHTARAVIARSTQPDIFRHIVYRSTGRRLPEAAPPQTDQFKVPHTPYVRERDPFEDLSPEPDAPPRPARGLSDTILDRIGQYDPLIRTYSRMNDLEPNLVRAVIYVESAGDRNAVSHKGAEGLMQLMPGTASDIGVSNSFDPAQNIYGGTRYLSTLLKRFKRVDLALWGYNAGPGAVRQKRLPLQTKRYIPNVLRVKSILDRGGA